MQQWFAKHAPKEPRSPTSVGALDLCSKLSSPAVQQGAGLQLCQHDHSLLWEALHGNNITDPGNSFSCLAFRDGGRGDSMVHSLIPSGQPTSTPASRSWERDLQTKGRVATPKGKSFFHTWRGQSGPRQQLSWVTAVGDGWRNPRN